MELTRGLPRELPRALLWKRCGSEREREREIEMERDRERDRERE